MTACRACLVAACVVALAGAAGAPGAAGASWPLYGKDLANSRNGGSHGPSPRQVASLPQTWKVDTSDGDITGTPVVAGGMVVVGTSGGTILGIDSVTGKLRWRRDVNEPINGSAAIVPGRSGGGVAYVPIAQTHRPRVIALSLARGKVLWDRVLDTQKDADVFGSPVVWNGSVFIGTSAYYGEFTNPSEDVRARGSVVALSARSGKVQWKRYTVPPGHDGGAVWSTPAIDTRTGRLFVGTSNAYHAPAAGTTDSILALDAHTGAILDGYQATPGDTWTLAEPLGPDFDFGASPNLFTAPNGRKIVGEGQKSGIYWALDRSTLNPVWHTRVGQGSSTGGVIGSTAFDAGRIYGPINSFGAGAEVWGLTRGGGMRWSSHETGPLNFSPVTVANGVVYISDFTSVVTARNAATGAVLGKLSVGSPSFAGVAVVGGAVYTATGTGKNPSGSVLAFGDTSASRVGGRRRARARRRLRLIVRPRRVRAGRRVRFRFRVTTTRRRPVRRVLIRFAGHRVRTRRSGRAKLVLRLRKTGRRPVRARKRGFRRAKKYVRVRKRSRHHRGHARHRHGSRRRGGR
jgi:polyvinyl alcohol dehydrogenase (cytochrome)